MMVNAEIYPLNKYYYNSSIVLKDLPKEDFNILCRNMTTHTYKKGEVIFRDGSYPAGVYYIDRGFVKRYKTDSQGKEQIVYVCNNGELMGCHAALCNEKYLDSAATLEDSTISFIPREDFLAAVDTSPSFARIVLTLFSHLFGVLVNTVTIQGQYPVREKVIFTLIYLHEKYKLAGYVVDKGVNISISRTDLANMVGTSKETVVRVLRELKDKDILNTSGALITIKDVNRLLKLLNY